MQRYHAASTTNAVNNSAIGGRPAKDSSRSEASHLTSNFPLNSRRHIQVTPYKLRCEKETLNSRLGPPDFNPPTLNCPEETLTREYAQIGYRETVEGLEESREISLSQAQTFGKPLILKCKESIRKCHRAINESRSRKRKEGQVYGVPLSGNLLTKPGIFLEQRPSAEDFRKKWIEGLSQPHKRLRLLADHVPHGYKKTSLLEVLIRNNVPLLRATWFVKITYLNQVHPGSSSTPEKTQYSRSEQWTKDLVDYLQHLLDESLSRSKSHSIVNVRDRSAQIHSGPLHHKSNKTSAVVDSEEPSFYFKWWYVVRILQWHCTERLLLPSLVIDWVLKQLQEKESFGVLQLLIPIVFAVLETIVLSQSHVRKLVGVAVHFISEPSPGGSDLVDNSRRTYTTSALVEMLRYLLLSVPDTFVALDCFPLPSCVVSQVVNDGGSLTKVSEELGKIRNGPMGISSVDREERGLEVQGQPLPIDSIVSSIQKRATNLARAARPSHPGHNEAKAVQALDKALINGDVTVAYRFLFENISDGSVDPRWITDVSSCLRSSLKWIGNIRFSFLCSVFFICEWATCDFRDVRSGPTNCLKFTGGRDFSQVNIALRLLKLTKQNIQSSLRGKGGCSTGTGDHMVGTGQLNDFFERKSPSSLSKLKRTLKSLDRKRKDLLEVFQSPGPLHDIIVCWIDQHESQNREGFKRLQLLITELTRSGIFYPQAYVRQLIVSGIMDGPPADLDRRTRHYKIIKELPGSFVFDALEEAEVIDMAVLAEAMHVYSNERRSVLCGIVGHHKSIKRACKLSRKRKSYQNTGIGSSSLSAEDGGTKESASSFISGKHANSIARMEALKVCISVLLQFPSLASACANAGVDDAQETNKRYAGSISPRHAIGEGTPGCEECKRMKRQKLNEEKYLPGNPPNLLDDEDIWWVKKGPKSSESVRTDPPVKSTKQASRGRRKTQSLAQLASARIEGSQGASTSHLCDSKISCPHHGPGNDGDAPKSVDGAGIPAGNIDSIGKALKQLRFVEKRVISVWLIATARQLVEDTEKTGVKIGQYTRPLPAVDDHVSVQWKLGEDELSALMYLMDICNDVVSGAKFLLQLLPKVSNIPSSSLQGGRNNFMLSRNVENHVCAIGETFLLSTLRRYENMLAAADLIPETLSALIHRATVILTSNGRVSGSGSLTYACHLLKKYGDVKSVAEWDINLKATGDKRLISELESGRSSDGEYEFPLGVPAGVEDVDDFLRQKITGIRASRLGLSMKDIVQRHVDEAYHCYGRERKLVSGGGYKNPSLEKVDDGYQIAQQTVMGLMECIRHTGGAAQEGDPTLVSSAVSAIVNNSGQVIAKIPELTASGNSHNPQSTSGSLSFARRILRIHITCLALLKEALGERQSRVFEIALATEASSAIAQLLAPGKNPRGQFQMSPEAHDVNCNSSYDTLKNTKPVHGRASKSTAAVSALVVGAILQGIAPLERMVAVFKLKEGLDVIQFVRSMRSNSNGNSRSMGSFKVDNAIEVSVHWFRVLVGNCRTVSDGFIVELLGEASIVALSRMQRMLPLRLVFPPAYSIFTFVVWRPFILKSSTVARDDLPQLHHSLTLAINDVMKHLPFRDVCLRDTLGFYDIVSADTTDSEFAAMLELSGSDVRSKGLAFVPLRSRLFLNAMIDCILPQHLLAQDNGSWVPGHGEPKLHSAENEAKILDKIVHVLDTLQPAKFHWQWVELRLLLNEQSIVEKLEHETSLVEAIHSLYPDHNKVAASENENNFIEIILTRLLVRPNAVPLYSEVVHLLGRSLKESMLLQAKWFLGGHDVLFGRKSIRQRLVNIAESKGLSTEAQFWRPWGWCNSSFKLANNKREKRKFETTSLEEGEVIDEGVDSNRYSKRPSKLLDVKASTVGRQHETERAFTELVLPCIDQSSDDSRSTFASDLIKQMNNIEQQISAVTCGANKQVGTVTSGVEVSSGNRNSRKGAKGGSPGIARRPAVPIETALPSPPALRSSMSLRLQFLLRLLPLVCADGEPSGRNMRYMLATVILRLLGSRVVYEDQDQSFSSSLEREVELLMEASSAASIDLSGENLFDRLLLVLHGLLSSCQPSWLKLKSNSKSTTECTRGFTVFDRDVTQSLQNHLDCMILPDTIRWRIQSAMPVLFSSVRCSITCQLPSVPASALSSLQPSISISRLHPGNINPTQRNQVSSARSATHGAGKNKPSVLQQDVGVEVDPWTLLEEGTEPGPSSSSTAVIGGSDQAKASTWLKGAVRVRRMDLTYIGSVDEDS